MYDIDHSFIIYCLRCRVSNKSYIGMTSKTIEQRWHRHCYNAKRGLGGHLYNAIRKYGTDVWEITVLEHNIPTLEQARKAEQCHIAEINTRTNGYNRTEGGEGSIGYKWTEEQRRKHTEIQNRPATRLKRSQSLRGCNHPNWGKHLPLEHRLRIAAAEKGSKNHRYGKHLSDSTKSKLRTYSLGTHRSEDIKKRISATMKIHRHKISNFRDSDIPELYRLLDEKVGHRAIAKRFHISTTTITKLAKRRQEDQKQTNFITE